MITELSSLDITFWIMGGAVFFLLLLSAFFSGSETALTAASRGKLRSQADRGDPRAEKALEVTEDNERLIGSVLLGNNLVNILATALATSVFTRLLGQGGVAMATLVMTFLVLIFAEVLPKTYAISNPEIAAARVARPISIVVRLFSPLVSAVRSLVRGILRIFGVSTNPDANILALKEEIVGTLSLGHSEGVVEKEDRDRIIGALDLSERNVEEVMLHRSDIEMIDADNNTSDILRQCLSSNYTRLPVYKDHVENIIGVIHAKDLLREVHRLWELGDMTMEPFEEFDLSVVTKPAYFVPDTTSLDEQMRQFLKRRAHFALVVDEYGALQGLITLEDIIEEIVGEIADEFDEEYEDALTAQKDGSFLVEGNRTIRDLNRAMDWNLPDEEANTIAGLVIHEAQTIPTIGQTFIFHDMRFFITAREGNRITEIKLTPLSFEKNG